MYAVGKTLDTVDGGAVKHLEIFYSARNAAFPIAVIKISLGQRILIALLIKSPPVLFAGPGGVISLVNVFP